MIRSSKKQSSRTQLRCWLLSLVLGAPSFALGQSEDTTILVSDQSAVAGHEAPVGGHCGCTAVEATPVCRDACQDSLSLGSWLDGEQSSIRKNLAANGITFQNNLTSFYFGNTAGGLEQDFRFGGHGDYLTNIDINKLGGPQGQFLKIRAEHRYGQSIADATGSLLPATLAADLPTVDSTNVYLTNVLFTQALSESFALYAGKLDSLDGDMNAFAHGRGIRQFSNSAFVVNPIGLRTVAYSTLGTGFVFLQDGEPIYNFLVLNARDTTKTDGLSELFADGAVISNEIRLPTNFFGMPGHQTFGAIWSSRDFAALDQSPLIVLPNVPIAQHSGSWACTYNFDQYLFTDPHNCERGWGLFGRAGIADPNTNPIRYFLSLGVGGNSRLQGRENDTFGLGWYYAGTSKEIAPFIAGIFDLRDGQGGEAYYNIAVNKRFSITSDTQVLVPSRGNVDTALIWGLRANLAF